MDKLLSIIIPVYGVEKYLDQAIESVVSQSYKNIEIILVDDGSIDSCPEKCDSWKMKDSRIKVIHKKNGGLSDARNAGIKMAAGEYIAFVDSDDFIDADMYKTMISNIENEEADIAVCGRFIYTDKIISDKYTLPCKKIFTGEEAIKEMLCARCMEEAVWDKVYKRKLFEDIWFPVGQINEDIVVTPKVLHRCRKVIHVGNAFYYYRINQTGISKSHYNAKKHIVIEHMEKVSSWVLNKYPNMKKEVATFRTRYAYAALLGLSIDKQSIRKYHDDYKYHLNILYHNYILIILNEKFSFRDDIKAVLILLRIYGILWRLKYKFIGIHGV